MTNLPKWFVGVGKRSNKRMPQDFGRLFAALEIAWDALGSIRNLQMARTDRAVALEAMRRIEALGSEAEPRGDER